MTFSEGKDFIISRIVNQAVLEGAPLSDLERDMLRFTEEPAYSGPEMADLIERFSQKYEDDEYEERISGLIHRAYQADQPDWSRKSQWDDALHSMQGHDVYLMVMLEEADIGYESEIASHLNLLPVGVIVVLVAMVIWWLTARSN